MPRPQKTAIVTGGGTGLGRALALKLSSDGYRVGVLARSEDALREVCGEIRARGAVAEYRTCDVTDADALSKRVDELVEALGGTIDLVVVNAGAIGFVKDGVFPRERIDRILRTNLMGSINTVHAVAPAMIEQGFGQIVGVSSLGAFARRPPGGLKYYFASKRCLTTVLGAYATHLKHHGVAVTTVHPGWIETDMLDPEHARTRPRRYIQTPDEAARRIARAIDRREDAIFPRELFLRIQLWNFSSAAREAGRWLLERMHLARPS